MLKLSKLLDSKNKNKIVNLCYYMKEAFSLRKLFFNTIENEIVQRL